MPIISFDELPDDARLWVFGSDAAIAESPAATLLEAVDDFLERWHAHGESLTSAREWRDDHFLVIGVDQSTAGASGCSIDGLFRTLRALEPQLGASLLAGGRVFYRDASGSVRSVTRTRFGELAREGVVSLDTRVLDTTVPTIGALRTGFERPARESWARELIER